MAFDIKISLSNKEALNIANSLLNEISITYTEACTDRSVTVNLGMNLVNLDMNIYTIDLNEWLVKPNTSIIVSVPGTSYTRFVSSRNVTTLRFSYNSINFGLVRITLHFGTIECYECPPIIQSESEGDEEDEIPNIPDGGQIP